MCVSPYAIPSRNPGVPSCMRSLTGRCPRRPIRLRPERSMSGSDESEVADSRAPSSGPGSRRQRGGGPRHPRHMTLMGWVSIAVVAALVIVTLGAYVKDREVWDSIRRVDVTNLGHPPPPHVSPTSTNAPNLLAFPPG